MAKDKPRYPESDKPHLSASSVEMFCRCPESYRRRYLENERSPPVLAMAKGKAFHSGIEHNMNAKMANGLDMDINEVVDFTLTSFNDSKGEVELTEIEKSVGGLNKVNTSLTGLMMSHMTNAAPLYTPLVIEKGFRLELPGKYDFVGVIDMLGLVDGVEEHKMDFTVVDWKSAKRKPVADSQHDSIQLTAYAAEVMNNSEITSVKTRLDVIVDKAKTYPHHIYESERDAGDVTALARRIDVVSKTIDAGLFPPAVTGSWWCSPGWCGYWKTCPYVNAERREAAKQNEIIEQTLVQLGSESSVPF